MHRKTWCCDDKIPESRPYSTGRRTAWDEPSRRAPNERYYSQPATYGMPTRKSRKQYLGQLLSEFEKCTEQSDDLLQIRKVG